MAAAHTSNVGNVGAVAPDMIYRSNDEWHRMIRAETSRKGSSHTNEYACSENHLTVRSNKQIAIS